MAFLWHFDVTTSHGRLQVLSPAQYEIRVGIHAAPGTEHNLRASFPKQVGAAPSPHYRGLPTTSALPVDSVVKSSKHTVVWRSTFSMNSLLLHFV